MIQPRFSEAEPMDGDQELPLDEYEVHPVADLFPMLSEDELWELAEDIRTRGQLQPIMLDSKGRILDGRNRLAACRLAGIEPVLSYYDGEDPAGYALAVNVARRSLTAGQKSMIVAKSATLAGNHTDVDVSNKSLQRARAVLEFAPDLATRVVDGTMPLAEAYEHAQSRKRATEAARAAKVRLRDGAPDLLTLVEDERMSLDDAVAALDARKAKAAEDERRQRSEAEAARIAAEQDEMDAIARHKARVESVAAGWSTVRDYVIAKPDDERTQRILNSLGETTRQTLKEILKEIGV